MDKPVSDPSPDKNEFEKQKEVAMRQNEIAQLQQSTAEANQKQAEAEKLKKAAEAQSEQLVAEAKQKTAEAEKAAFLAKFPKGEKPGLEGTIATVNFGYGAEITAYEAVSRILFDLSTKIKSELSRKKDVRILIVDDLNFALGDTIRLQLQKTFDVMKELLNEQISSNDQLTEESSRIIQKTGRLKEHRVAVSPATAVPMVFESLISSAADLASYFQSNFAVTGQEFEVARDAIVHEFVGLIKELNPIISNFYVLENSKILDSLTALLKLKQQLMNSQSALNINGIEPLMAIIDGQTVILQNIKDNLGKTAHNPARGKTAEKIKRIEDALAEENKALDAAKAANGKTIALADAFDKFVEDVSKPASPTEVPLLAQAALREAIFEKQVSHLLWMKPISSGGYAITKQQIFSSGHVSYVGGFVISYVLAATDGTIVSSGTLHGLSQISHVLSTNRDYRLQHVILKPAQKNLLDRFYDWLKI